MVYSESPRKELFGHVWVRGGAEDSSKGHSAGNEDQPGIFGSFSGFLTLNFTQLGSHLQVLTLETPYNHLDQNSRIEKGIHQLLDNGT